jgi:hypothetical protein
MTVMRTAAPCAQGRLLQKIPTSSTKAAHHSAESGEFKKDVKVMTMETAALILASC